MSTKTIPPITAPMAKPEKKQQHKISQALPYAPAPYTTAHLKAVWAVYHGEANPEQQKRAMEWIINVVAMANELTFFPGGIDGQRLSDFAAGKSHVGKQIQKAITLVTKNPEQYLRD